MPGLVSARAVVRRLAVRRRASKGGAGKMRYNECCGQPAAGDAGALACGKKRQQDCQFRGVVQTVAGLHRLTVPEKQTGRRVAHEGGALLAEA